MVTYKPTYLISNGCGHNKEGSEDIIQCNNWLIWFYLVFTCHMVLGRVHAPAKLFSCKILRNNRKWTHVLDHHLLSLTPSPFNSGALILHTWTWLRPNCWTYFVTWASRTNRDCALKLYAIFRNYHKCSKSIKLHQRTQINCINVSSKFLQHLIYFHN